MTHMIREEMKDDLLARGYSRRQMMRAALMFSGATAAALSLSTELAFAQEDEAAHEMVRIGLNECWVGPMAPGLKAGNAAFANSNRYSPHGEAGQLIKAIATMENLPEDHVVTYAGSGEILARTVVAYCSPTKALVQANPSYDSPQRVAEAINVPVTYVPLTSDYRHDVKAMLAANPNGGVYYVVNPNNPTGTMTPMAEIEWLVDNKPAGSVVLLDEAYIHWSKDYPNNTATHLIRAGKDVVLTRTFSKVFGMAGARVGFLMARPDIAKKIGLYDHGERPTIPTTACATASLTQVALMNARRKEMWENRAMTVAYLTKRGLKLIGRSEANMIMVDWKTKSAKDMDAIYKAAGVQIARPRWPIWPNVGRISIGSKADMEAFMNATGKILA
ncbi:MAG: aminotransferase class I/II-fold pyridoxal phosphate-dependent enzyme [Rhizomicrobium sp.]